MFIINTTGWVDIIRDDYEHGEVSGYETSWTFNAQGVYAKFSELVAAVSKAACLEFDSKACSWYVDTDGKAYLNVSLLVDEDKTKPDDKQIASWKLGKCTLYNAYLRILVMYIPEQPSNVPIDMLVTTGAEIDDDRSNETRYNDELNKRIGEVVWHGQDVQTSFIEKYGRLPMYGELSDSIENVEGSLRRWEDASISHGWEVIEQELI